MKLSDTQTAILTAAAQHPEHLAYPPERLPAGARQKVAQALLKNDLVIAVRRADPDAHALWPVDGDSVLLKITDEGLRAVGIEPEEDEQSEAAIQRRNAERRAAPEAHTPPQGREAPTPQGETTDAAEAAQGAPQAPAEAAPAPRASQGFRSAATALLAAWDNEANREADMITALDSPMQALRAALAGKPARMPRDTSSPRKPREGTKQEAVLALLRRAEGATIGQIVDATGWQQHTVRGFFAGLKKRQGIAVEVMERVRQVGPGKDGAKGSYSIYRIADAG